MRMTGPGRTSAKRTRLSSVIAPAPWQLTGRGYIIALHCSPAFGEGCRRDGPDFNATALGGMGALMVVDYRDSNVGPYRELLLCPGAFRIGSERALVVTHIWVSTQASESNGRRNWGLPKQIARFEAAQHADGSETVRVQQRDKPALTLTFAPRGPNLPLNTRIVPQRLRTLTQPCGDRLYRTRIRARGRIRLAGLAGWNNPQASGFPDFTSQRQILGLSVSRFELHFPVPEISPAIAV